MEGQSAAYSRHHPPATGGREDCWSEGATSTLIEAWGDRHLQLSRGNLRQKDWKEVADAVNSRQDSLNKPRKTDIQCKNRIDTLKKKYKVEKSKVAPSKWPFYHRLDSLVGTAPTPISNNNSSRKNLNPVKMTPSVAFTVKNVKNPDLNPNSVAYSAGSSSKSRLNSAGLSESSRGGDNNDDDHNDVLYNNVAGGGVKKHRQDSVEDLPAAYGGGSAFRELARVILKFGEIYERIESEKQEQMMELERQRMEFTKELEFQRMQMFMEVQLEVEKMKRPKYSSGGC